MSKIIAAGRLAVPTTTPGSTFNYTWANPNGSGSTLRYNRIAPYNLVYGFNISQELINAGWNGVDPVVWTIEGYQSIYRQAVQGIGYNSATYYNRSTIYIDGATYNGITPSFAGGLEIETGDYVYIFGQGGQGSNYVTSTTTTRGGGSAIHTLISFTLNAGQYNFILGGGGAGGPVNFAERDTVSSKRGSSTTYDNVFICGGAGGGGHTHGPSTLNDNTVGTSMGALSTTDSYQSTYTSWANSDTQHYGSANGLGGQQGGGGAIALWRRYPEFSATTQTLWGGGGGHYTGVTALGTYSTNAQGLTGPNGSSVSAGRGSNYSWSGFNASAVNNSLDDNISLGGGGGGGFGSPGGSGRSYSYNGLSSSVGTAYTYSGGTAGYAIFKQAGASVTYDGRTPTTSASANLSTVVYMRGFY